MTNAQKIFCDEYLIDMNATRAYKVAYPNTKNERTARSAGSRLLTNVNVKTYIEERMKEKEDERIAEQDEILKYLTSVLRGETESEVIVVEGEGDGYSSARRILKRPDEKEKMKAAELLGKRYGLFVDKKDINANVAEIKVELVD